MVEVDKAKLLEYIERIEAYNDTITDATASKKEILAEAEAAGFNKKGINYIIKQRKRIVIKLQKNKNCLVHIQKLLDYN